MFFKNTFKQREPKRFKYIPRFINEDQEYQGLRFRRFFEESDVVSFNVSNQRKDSRRHSRNSGNSVVSIRLLIIIFILSLIAYFVLDFDFDFSLFNY